MNIDRITDNTQVLGVTLKSMRNKAKLTQRIVASRVNMRPSTYAYLELGYTELKVTTLMKVLDAMGIDMVDFWVEFEHIKIKLEGLSVSVVRKKASPVSAKHICFLLEILIDYKP